MHTQKIKSEKQNSHSSWINKKKNKNKNENSLLSVMFVVFVAMSERWLRVVYLCTRVIEEVIVLLIKSSNSSERVKQKNNEMTKYECPSDTSTISIIFSSFLPISGLIFCV